MTGLDLSDQMAVENQLDEDDHGNLKAGRRKHYDR